MGIKVAIEHTTTYRFDRLVELSPHIVRLRPAPHSRTPIVAYSLQVEPADHFINWQQDPFGNYQARLVFPEKTRELSISVDLVADMTVINPFDFFVDEYAEHYPFTYEADLARDLGPYLAIDDAGPQLEEWVASARLAPGEEQLIVPFLFGLNQRLQHDVAYTVRLEPGVQTPEETLEKRLGSCRDTGWLLVQILRRFGLAARFVSGYLIQLTADTPALDGPSGPESDFTDLHAWAEVYVPGAGWLGLDPTSGLFAGEGHIPLSCTPQPTTAAPVTGAVEPCEVTLEFANEVHRIHEDPRVTLPYTDAQWARVDHLGAQTDRELAAADVRLTMGGEPTFVSIDDMEAPEWNTAADGEHKRALAADLARRLADRFAPGGVLQYGQGKWYPGEPLPRWQIGVMWRVDGEPIWRDRTLCADPWTPGSAEPAAAEQLAHGIARALGVAADCVLPAFEDPLAQLLAEARLPTGEPPLLDVDPEDARLPERDERAELVGLLDRMAGSPCGWVLPLHWSFDGDTWATSRWSVRRGKLLLTPGDSPVGLRLPLDSITWHLPATPEPLTAFAPPEPLPVPPEAGAGQPSEPPAPEEEAPVVPTDEAPPTALCVEVRDGNVHVFLPPVTKVSHALALLATVEAVAAAQVCPVVLEGYPPPHDRRLHHLSVATDPGVIEVNVHPAGSWEELVAITTALHEDARLARLGTEKFDLDGTHTGTGGGNHVTLGGPSPADSPLLRRPALLRSLVTYWQHHPALSYLFSGRFIGPTSQSPRVDEGRDENLYELEIAFDELDRLEGEGDLDARLWLVDRLLRNLLVDITGNTHRAEFCIDKLYSPETERGRLGLVELRAFEMPPHPRMALVQALLVRALVCRFWKAPYREPLVRWGTELHDRFLLPWYVSADMADVVEDLGRHGYAFEQAWLAPFVEFRFPQIGTVEVAGTTLELRRAIEPWHVLGEEITASGTARYVDSSVERLQVRVDGFDPARHVVTCNGRAVPLRTTGIAGTHVAGLRYRAWAPPSALHPTIGVHAPLVFDLIDRWSGRSLGGCTYHVAHPGGRSYDVFPVNANEAEARRASRFEPQGHTPGPVDLAALPPLDRARAGEYPRTLDLRRYGS